MRRRSEPNTFDERLSAEKVLITMALENTPAAQLELKLRQTNRPSYRRLGLIDGDAPAGLTLG
jgi:hypothetical protein